MATQKAGLARLESKHKKKIAEFEKSLASRSEELARTQTRVQSLAVEKEKQLQQIAEFEDSIGERTKEFAEMQQTLRINNKLLLKSDADLKDLQIQYRTALHHQEQQHALLVELKKKLRQASEFYQKLNLQNLVLDGDLLAQGDSEPAGLPGDEDS